MSARVQQLLSGAGPFDAITNQALAWQRILAATGREGDVYAASFDPRLDGAVRPAESLAGRVRDDDLLVIHYSAHASALDEAAALPNRKLLVYHNITPARYLWDHEPYVAMLCALGREGLRRLAGRVDGAIAPSEFSAHDLRDAGFPDVRVAPAIYQFDRERLRPGAGDETPYAGDGRRTIVFVGRLSHNKRQDRLVKALALHQRHCDPEARLVLPGSPGSGTYGEYLARLALDAGARDVVLPGALPQPALNALYARADVFCCLSEHEGFCIPLLEALHFGLPVVAARAAAVPEVLGDAGVLLDDPDLPTVSEAIELCASSASLREELRTRGERRLEEFTPERTEAAVREAIDGLEGGQTP
jgi:glycosyltransferase involved in cell wall biosynthesis